MTPPAAWRKTGVTKHIKPSGNGKGIDAALTRGKLAGVLILNGTMLMSPQHRIRYGINDYELTAVDFVYWQCMAL
jgi:hypothetical protein